MNVAKTISKSNRYNKEYVETLKKEFVENLLLLKDAVNEDSPKAAKKNLQSGLRYMGSCLVQLSSVLFELSDMIEKDNPSEDDVKKAFHATFMADCESADMALVRLSKKMNCFYVQLVPHSKLVANLLEKLRKPK